MDLVNLPISQLIEARWNPNHMDFVMLSKLLKSITKFGMMGNLVVRPLDDGMYEVLSGNQRLQVLRKLDYSHVPCVVVDLDDAEARLLAQALNRIEGEDDLGLKAELFKEVLRTLPQSEVLSILPESAESLKALTTLGEIDVAQHLRAWQQAQSARLRHLTFQFSGDQSELVEQALARALAGYVAQEGSPNRRGTALTDICRYYPETMGGD